jgi:hypothetical protein
VTAPGAHFQIAVDGVPRSYRDVRDTAIEAARLLQSRNPGAKIVVTEDYWLHGFNLRAASCIALPTAANRRNPAVIQDEPARYRAWCGILVIDSPTPCGKISATRGDVMSIRVRRCFTA